MAAVSNGDTVTSDDDDYASSPSQMDSGQEGTTPCKTCTSEIPNSELEFGGGYCIACFSAHIKESGKCKVCNMVTTLAILEFNGGTCIACFAQTKLEKNSIGKCNVCNLGAKQAILDFNGGCCSPCFVKNVKKEELWGKCLVCTRASRTVKLARRNGKCLKCYRAGESSLPPSIGRKSGKLLVRTKITCKVCGKKCTPSPLAIKDCCYPCTRSLRTREAFIKSCSFQFGPTTRCVVCHIDRKTKTLTQFGVCHLCLKRKSSKSQLELRVASSNLQETKTTKRQKVDELQYTEVPHLSCKDCSDHNLVVALIRENEDLKSSLLGYELTGLKM